eukprot:GHVL01040839.1.p2 GENE.GHVL01040839.1~~GHVL01040839.1.p2  ORF type:complete len:130 (+),score=14.24 GHVL01040839.1:601-990(+)
MVFRPLPEFGYLRCPSKVNPKHLQLWGFENSPFVKRVREVLDVLELSYIVHPLPHGSSNRSKFAADHEASLSQVRKCLKLCQVPYLRDPNTGVCMFESKDIVEYLRREYKTGQPVNESWADFASKGKQH